MRINNPKSLAGYTRGLTNNDGNYSLVTLQQLENAVSAINKKFMDLLTGIDADGYAANGLGGVSNKCGYAWINQNTKKIDAALLPALAITNTIPVAQSDLTSITTDELAASPDPTSTDEAIIRLRYLISHDDSTTPKFSDLQKGDIIIVSPAIDEIANPVYCGSYIVTDYSSDTGYSFSKLAYEAGKISSINSLVANGAGALTIQLGDILKNYPSSRDDDDDLTKNIYRISSTSGVTLDGQNDKFRFKFNNIEYASLGELNTETESRIATDNYISGIVDALSSFTYEKIGNTESAGDRALSAAIYPQLKALRDDVDFNASLLNTSRQHTNEFLDIIFGETKQLSGVLNKKMVEINEREFTWSDDNVVDHAESYGSSISNSLDEEIGIQLKNNAYSDWTYTYTVDSTYEDEKIIAVFDENGNKVEADVKRGTDSTSQNKWYISVSLDKILDNTNTNINVLSGKKWKLLVSSTIKFTYTNTPPVGSVTVGGADSAYRS